MNSKEEKIVKTFVPITSKNSASGTVFCRTGFSSSVASSTVILYCHESFSLNLIRRINNFKEHYLHSVKNGQPFSRLQPRCH